MAQQLNEQQILLLNNLMYMDSSIAADFVTPMNAAEKMTVGEFVNSITFDQIDKNVSSDAFTTNSDWKSMVQMIRDDPALCNVQLVDSYHDALDGRAAVFVDPSTNEAIVTFKGTGTYEWREDVTAATMSTTPQQQRALDWFQGKSAGESGARLDLSSYDSVTVTGHSKGGNKAKYITVMDDTGTVDRCISFDGQGFSKEFHKENADRIAANEGKIQNHNLAEDYVSPLMHDVGNTTYYKGYGLDGKVLRGHCPDSFLDFKGGDHMKEAPQSENMRKWGEAINGILDVIDTMGEGDQMFLLNTFGGAFQVFMGLMDAPEKLKQWLDDPFNLEKAGELLLFIPKNILSTLDGYVGYIKDKFNRLKNMFSKGKGAPAKKSAVKQRPGTFTGRFRLSSKDLLMSVVPSELRQAATALERAAEEYIAASSVAQDAAYDLTSKWEGDAQQVFVTEQEQAFGWYFKMGDLCWSYAKFLRQAADEYEEADRQARRAIE